MGTGWGVCWDWMGSVWGLDEECVGTGWGVCGDGMRSVWGLGGECVGTGGGSVWTNSLIKLL